jgi:prophage regulatory protein
MVLLGTGEPMTEVTKSTLALMHDQQAQARARVLRRPEVELRTGLSRSAIYALMAKQQFPVAIPLTAKAVGWLESSIESWIAERVSVGAR